MVHQRSTPTIFIWFTLLCTSNVIAMQLSAPKEKPLIPLFYDTDHVLTSGLVRIGIQEGLDVDTSISQAKHNWTTWENIPLRIQTRVLKHADDWRTYLPLLSLAQRKQHNSDTEFSLEDLVNTVHPELKTHCTEKPLKTKNFNWRQILFIKKLYEGLPFDMCNKLKEFVDDDFKKVFILQRMHAESYAISRQINVNKSPVTTLTISGNLLFSGHTNGEIIGHSLPDLKEQKYPNNHYKIIHTKPVTSLTSYMNNENNLSLFSASEDGLYGTFLDEGALVNYPFCRTEALCAVRKGKIICLKGNGIVIFDDSTNELIVIRLPKPNTFFRWRQLVATITPTGDLILYVSCGSNILLVKPQNPEEQRVQIIENPSESPITCMKLDTDAGILLVGYFNCDIKAFKYKNETLCEVYSKFEGHTKGPLRMIRDLAVTDFLIASIDYDEMKFWNCDECIATFNVKDNFSLKKLESYGNTLITGHKDGTIALWDPTFDLYKRYMDISLAELICLKWFENPHKELSFTEKVWDLFKTKK